MKMRVLCGLFLMSLASHGWSSSCRMRVEVRDLTPQQLQDYIDAYLQLHQRRNGTGWSILDQYTCIHNRLFDSIHSPPFFFPWHRMILYHFENELRAINSNLLIPYWDWTYDAAAPNRSIILSDTWFGPPQQANSCLRTGPFRDLKVRYPVPRCLKRHFDPKRTFVSQPELQKLLLASTNFSMLHQNIYAIPHGLPHLTTGGDMAIGVSPNDPLFFLHHAFVDKMWYDWQGMGHEEDYPWNKSAIMPGFNITVEQMLNPSNPQNCIRYAPPKAILGQVEKELEPHNSSTSSTLPQPFVFHPAPLPNTPIANPPLSFLQMHNITQEDFDVVKNMVESVRFQLSALTEGLEQFHFINKSNL